MRPPVRSRTPVISPSGALRYTGNLFREWQGSLLAGGLSSQALVRLVLDGERVALEERIHMGRRIRDVAQAPDGALLLIVGAATNSRSDAGTSGREVHVAKQGREAG